jgi:hypothetical protein
MIRRLGLLFILFFTAAHCGGQVTAVSASPDGSAHEAGHPDAQTPQSDAGGSCTRDSDCPDGNRCAFSAAEACGWDGQRCKTGKCMVPVGPRKCSEVSTVTACGCDGAPVSWTGECGAVFPEGFAPVPFAHLGACAPACTSPSDCAAGEACGYAAGAGCAAKGQCFSPGACDCNNLCCSSTTAPACDGSVAEVDCQGFATKPVCSTACD